MLVIVGKGDKEMKVYFEDGQLRSPNNLSFSASYRVDASDGFSENQKLLNSIKLFSPTGATVYTNSLVALDNKYCWSDASRTPELYFRPHPNADFVRADKLTRRELRETHNLEKLYVNGEFNRVC